MSECTKCGEVTCHCWLKDIPSYDVLFEEEIKKAIASADPNDIKITQAYASLLDLIGSGAEWEEGLFDAYDVVLRSHRNKREKQRTMHYVFGTNSICLIDEYGRVSEFPLFLTLVAEEIDVPGLKGHFKYGVVDFDPEQAGVPISMKNVSSYNSIQDIFAAAKEQETYPVLNTETGRLGIE